MDEVLTKSHNYRLWQGGTFGNKLRSWRTLDEWRASGFSGKVALRTLAQVPGPCRYNLSPNEVSEVVSLWLASEISSDCIMVNEMGNDDCILQGEYLNDIYLIDDYPRWGYFLYTRVQAPMRDALAAKSEVAYSLRADLLIRQSMTPASYEDWLVLLDQYHGHVLEVSIYDRCLGDIPGRNALVWEVRRY